MPIDLKMAWRNVWRNPRRTILTMLAVAFACLLLVFMLSFQFGSYDIMINAAVKMHTGHFQVQHKGYLNDRKMRQVVPHPEETAALVRNAPNVEAVTVRANASSLASSKNRTFGVMVVGIDPKKEAKVSTLKDLIKKGAYLKEGDYQGALAGELLARNLEVGIGDEITILGQGRDGSVAATAVTLRGIYSSGQDDFDRSTLQMNLANFQDAYSMQGAVHEVVAVCKTLDDLPGAAAFVKQGLEPKAWAKKLVVLNWRQIMPGLWQGIQMDLGSAVIMYLILIIVVAFSILNTFLMAIMERMREFGVIMAVGARPGRLIKIVFYESGLLTLMGVFAGMIGGALVTWYFEVHGISFEGSSELMAQFGISGSLYPRLSPLSLCLGPAVVMFITLITALYPAAKIRKLKPVEAMRYV